MRRKKKKLVRPETVWRLVEAHCSQLADAVKAARTPFLLALLWSFIWVWALYTTEYGYMSTLTARYQQLYLQMSSTHPADKKAFDESCIRILPQDSKANAAEKRKFCMEVVKQRFQWTTNANLESSLLSFPGGFGKLSVSDLGVIGQFGLLLILAWSFFAVRRENHAFRAIVDMDDHSRKLNRLFPSTFVLKPHADYFSDEHLAFAYHSVAQRFMFMFSRHSRPLLVVAIFLSAIPVLVATYTVGTDLWDFSALFKSFQQSGFLPAFVIRGIVSVALLLMLWGVTIKMMRIELDTSTLLNGWSLAARDVWSKQWDERDLKTATSVVVDVLDQKAKAQT